MANIPVFFQEMLYNLSCKVYKPMADTFNAAVLKAFPHKRKEEIKIIDVAAGTGLVGVELFKLGFTRIDALDSSQGMLNEAEKKNIYQRFFLRQINDQPIPEFNSGEYDALICVNAFGNSHILPSAFNEMCRIVSKGKNKILVYSYFFDRYRKAAIRTDVMLKSYDLNLFLSMS